MTREILHTPAIVICHGKSEKIIAEYLRRNLKIPIAVESENKGSTSIQIGKSLLNVLNNSKFRDYRGLNQYFGNLQFKRHFPQNLKIFPIMDLDDAENHLVESYKNGTMFSKHWLKDTIVPIYNDMNLEEALKSMGYPYEIKHNKKIARYVQIFPVDSANQNINAVDSFYQICKKSQKTNMDIMIKYLMDYTENVRNQRENRC